MKLDPVNTACTIHHHQLVWSHKKYVKSFPFFLIAKVTSFKVIQRHMFFKTWWCQPSANGPVRKAVALPSSDMSNEAGICSELLQQIIHLLHMHVSFLLSCTLFYLLWHIVISISYILQVFLVHFDVTPIYGFSWLKVQNACPRQVLNECFPCIKRVCVQCILKSSVVWCYTNHICLIDRAFTSLCYTADGNCILAGGQSKNVCIYNVREALLLKKFEISQNRSFDAVDVSIAMGLIFYLKVVLWDCECDMIWHGGGCCGMNCWTSAYVREHNNVRQTVISAVMRVVDYSFQ
jgi:hypothetical protein